jgi:hypothetical protein
MEEKGRGRMGNVKIGRGRIWQKGRKRKEIKKKRRKGML